MPNQKPFFYGAGDLTFIRAKLLRKPLTPAEALLWQALRNRKTDGFKFRRQHPIGPFIADFYCHAALLVVEVDGGMHDNPEVTRRDNERTWIMESEGLKVIRFRNEQVLGNLSVVLDEIAKVLSARTGTLP